MRYATTALGLLVVLIILALVFPYTGLYNVAATSGHTGLARWYLDTTSERSVATRADDVSVAVNLQDSALVAAGARSYAGMCQVCHGAPGQDRGVVGEGLTPTPPHLSEEVGEWKAEEAFWIVKHGIKMTGMPAFGPTHSDEDLWEIVAFLQRLPDMEPQEYEALTAESRNTSATSQADDGHDHAH